MKSFIPARAFGVSWGIASMVIAACAPANDLSPTQPPPAVVVIGASAGPLIHVRTINGNGTAQTDTTFAPSNQSGAARSVLSLRDSLAAGAMAAYILGKGPRSFLANDAVFPIGGAVITLKNVERGGSGRATTFTVQVGGSDSTIKVEMPTSPRSAGRLDVAVGTNVVSTTVFEVSGSGSASVQSLDELCGAALVSITTAISAGFVEGGVGGFLAVVSGFAAFAGWLDQCSSWLAQVAADYGAFCMQWPQACIQP